MFFSWGLLRCRGGVGAGARGGFNPLRGATTGVVMRRRATSGEMARGGVGFCFFLGGCSGVGGEWEREHEGGRIRCAGRPREWSCGAVPPQERWHEGGWFLFFLWGLLRCRGEWEREHEGDLIRCAGRPQEWSCGAVPPQERWHEGGWFLFFLWGLLRCRRGILSHPQARTGAGFPAILTRGIFRAIIGQLRRGGRVVDGARLESAYAATHRGFESHSLRQIYIPRIASVPSPT